MLPIAMSPLLTPLPKLDRLMVAKGAPAEGALVLAACSCCSILLWVSWARGRWWKGHPAPERLPSNALTLFTLLLDSGSTPCGPWNKRNDSARLQTASVPVGRGSDPTGLVGAMAKLVANSSPCSFAS